jgi:tryptophan synthase alpha subunit
VTGATAPPGGALGATLMVTPSTPDARLRAIAGRSRGFLYVMSVMATTGSAREQDDEGRWVLGGTSAAGIRAAVRALRAAVDAAR